MHHFSLALSTITLASALLTSWLFVTQNCSSARSCAAHFHIVRRVQGRQLPTCQHSAPLLPCSLDYHFGVSAPDIMVVCYAKLQQRAQPRCALSYCEPRPRTAAADVPTQCTTSSLLSRLARLRQRSLYYGRVLCKTAAARGTALHTFISCIAHFHFLSRVQGRQLPTCSCRCHFAHLTNVLAQSASAFQPLYLMHFGSARDLVCCSPKHGTLCIITPTQATQINSCAC